MNYCFVEGLVLKNMSDDLSIYYSDRMVKEGIYISVETLFKNDDDVDVQQEITVHTIGYQSHFYEYTLYIGEILANIQLHGLLKDLYDLYSSCPTIDKFHFILRDMALVYATSNPFELETPTKEDMEIIKSTLTQIHSTLNYLEHIDD